MASPHDTGFPLISFVCETDADLLPHFVRWYRRLGVDRFLLVMHGEWSPENLAMLAALPGVECARWVHEPFCKSLKCDEISALARRHTGEWVVFADADEFLELPVPTLAEMVPALEAAGIDELYAPLLQRVAADGSLPDVNPASDLDELFPLMHPGLCEDMGLRAPPWTSKYPLARIGRGFVYQRGNHLPGNSRSVAHVPMRAVLHHFKWRSRLFQAFTRERGEGTNSDEMAAYRRYLAEHGRLPLAGATPCSRAALEAEGWLRRPSPGELQSLAALAEERVAATRANLRIGFVTFELGGPGTPNGGIATAMSALAKLQAAHGVRVDVFYCPFHMPRTLPPLWFEYWSAFGITLHFVPRLAASEDRQLETHEVEAAIVAAVRNAGDFDLLHFHDTQGFAAAFTMLKAAGLAFTDTTLAITTHGGTRWHNEPNNTPWDEVAYRQELVGQRLCDVVVSPSSYLIEWNRSLDALPDRHVVLQNVLEPESKSFAPPRERPVVPECLAFFGRVEYRKGFDLFLAALRELAAATALRPEVLVLGRFGNGFDQERFDDEIRGLPYHVVHHKSLNPHQALRLLRHRNALAIMPSRQENSPYVAYEAMENQLPFLVSFTGGTAELIRPEDWPRAELPPDPAAMAEKIAGCLRHGLTPARLAVDPLRIELQNLVTWRGFATERGRSHPPHPLPGFSRHPLADWRAAASRAAGDLVALVPDELPVDPDVVDGMARLLAAAPFADVIEPWCRIVERESGRGMTSLQLKKKTTPRESALLTGPLPIVTRAGVLAEVAGALPSMPSDRIYGELMEAIGAGGKQVLSIPVETHTRRLAPDLAQRSLCTRLWLPIGRREQAERPPHKSDSIWQLCGMLSTDPFVAISMFSVDTPHGALSLFPEAFREIPSLHLVTLGSSLIWAAARMLPRRIAEAKERWPLAHIRVLAADEAELTALRAADVPAILGNLNMFVDERVFHPRRPSPMAAKMDAIFIGAMEIRENHFLARLVPSIGLVHDRYEGMDDVGSEVRRLLPRALYLTDAPERAEGFFYPSAGQLAGWICQASTGLALAETGGSCPATVQYLLCGTPVVSVPNIGGRDHFLEPPYAVETAPTAEAVAAAVATLKDRGLSREEMHEATRMRLVEARGRFLGEVNAVMREVFGPGPFIDDVSGLIGAASRYRRAIDVLRVPQAPNSGRSREGLRARRRRGYLW